jgi:hypothetical protein
MRNKKILLIEAVAVAFALAACGGKGTGSSESASSTTGSSSAATSASSTVTSSSGSSTVSSSSSSAPATVADGVFNYAGKMTNEQTSQAIAALESWGMRNHVSGIPVSDDGGLIVKADRVTFPTNTYVANFGFGAGRGTISSAMDSAHESVTDWASYFHSWTDTDGGTANDMDDQGSWASNLRGMVTASYYNQRLTADKENYEWYPLLASEEPIPLKAKGGEADKTLTSSKYYRFKVHTGGNYKYSTLSKAHSKYNGQAIALDDYVEPVRAMLQNGWYRKADMSKQFAGVSTYLTAYTNNPATADWAQVGFQANAIENSIDVEFVSAKTAFNAKYAISDSLYAPFPAAWLADVGPKNAFKMGSSTSDFYANMDNMISTGVYNGEYWESGKAIVFKKNPLYIEANDYHYAGYKFEVNASSTSTNDEFARWQDGYLDEDGVPSANVAEYATDPHTLHTLGATVENIQVNSCTAEEWQKYFGPNGTIKKHDATYTGYTVKPILSNDDFLDGIYFSINRTEYANAFGTNAAQAYLSNAYVVDNTTGLAYRNTDAGKAVIADRSPSTFGYNEETAIQLFKKAAAAEIAAGNYKKGDTITLTIQWRGESEMKLHSPYFKYDIETAWNKAGTGMYLTIDNITPSTTDYTVPYFNLQHGEADMMYGAIEGSVLDPLNFMDTLCSDGRDLTLSRGADSSLVDPTLIFDNHYWSYDALWSSTQGPTIVDQGKEGKAISKKDAEPTYDAATKTLTLNLNYIVSDSLKDFAVSQFYVDMTDGKTGGKVYDYEGYYDETGGKIDLGTKGSYDDGEADTNAVVLTPDGKGTMVLTLDLTNYVGNSRFNTASATNDETGDPKTIWFDLVYTANAGGNDVQGEVSYASVAAKTFFAIA